MQNQNVNGKITCPWHFFSHLATHSKSTLLPEMWWNLWLLKDVKLRLWCQYGQRCHFCLAKVWSELCGTCFTYDFESMTQTDFTDLLQMFLNYCFKFVCPLCIYVHECRLSPQRPVVDVGSLDAWVTGSYEQPDMLGTEVRSSRIATIALNH